MLESTTTPQDEQTEVGSYFVANYPPFSVWTPEAVATDARAALHQAPVPGTPLGLYMHIPFCRKRCHFCYFRVYTDKNANEVQDYLDVVAREWDLYKPLPAIVFVHGGGWQNGDKAGGSGLRNFVQTGNYVGFSVGYRLSGEATWPAQIHDCKAAIRWVRANAEKYWFDPERIGVWGTSAGGHGFGEQRNADCEFPADTQSGQQSVQGKVPEAGGERGEARENGVEQDGDEHRLGAAPAVAEHAEEQTAARPADQKQARGMATRHQRETVLHWAPSWTEAYWFGFASNFFLHPALQK